MEGGKWELLGAHFFYSVVVPTPFAEQVLTQVRTVVDPVLAARHVELVELTYRREGAQTVLRFLVDTVSGITIEQCGELSRVIGALLDEHDLIGERYCLEVASPGLDRPLKTERDFERVLGRRVWIQTTEPVDGVWEIRGTVSGVSEALVTIQQDQGPKVRVPLRLVSRARQEIAF